MDVWPELAAPPRRIVSLVPSLTETVCDFGLRARLVGRTDFCIHPDDLGAVPGLGGPKNPDLHRLLALTPDLVLANHEENRPEDLEALQSAGVPVAISCPLTVTEALSMLWRLAALLGVPERAQMVDQIERAYTWQLRAVEAGPRRTVFCPIWREPHGPLPAEWLMTIDSRTYVHDMLRVMGLDNVFADRPRRYPLAADLGQAEPQDPGVRDTRYPRVTPAELVAHDPQVVLLPSEPYAFAQEDQAAFEDQFAALSAVRDRQVLRVDGTLLTWAGTRVGRALRQLPALLAENLQSKL